MSVSLICGPMFSGKSTELFRRIRREEYAGKTTLIYKYAQDTRYNDRAELACSHDGRERVAVPINSFKNIAIPEHVDVIGVDEGQFIEGLVEFCDSAAQQGITVIVAALDSDYKRDPFPSVIQLVSKSEHVRKLHSVCILCGKNAAFTRRLTANQVVEDIGGADKYLASCRQCFQSPIPPATLARYQNKINLGNEN